MEFRILMLAALCVAGAMPVHAQGTGKASGYRSVPACGAPGRRTALADRSAVDRRVADPPAIHGIYVALNNPLPSTSPLRRNPALVERYLVHDDTLCGANLLVAWSAVDRGPGQHPRYDWSSVDKAAAPWIKVSKDVNLIVWGVAYDSTLSPTPVTPAYVLRGVPTVTCPGTNDPVTPVYWNAGYAQNYQTFMRAVVSRYGRDPSVGYIRFGLGVGGEDYPANHMTGSCLSAWQAQGLSPRRWIDYSTAMIAFERTLTSRIPRFSRTSLMVGINPLPGYPHSSVPDIVARAAVQNGLGFGMQGLTVKQGANYRQGKPCYADWCALFRRYVGRVPLEVQTYTRSNPNGGGPSGSLPALLHLALQARAQILELWPEEWLVTNDPNSPFHAAHSLAYRNALSVAATGSRRSYRLTAACHPAHADAEVTLEPPSWALIAPGS